LYVIESMITVWVVCCIDAGNQSMMSSTSGNRGGAGMTGWSL
jgi:hypothetical protein